MYLGIQDRLLVVYQLICRGSGINWKAVGPTEIFRKTCVDRVHAVTRIRVGLAAFVRVVTFGNGVETHQWTDTFDLDIQ